MVPADFLLQETDEERVRAYRWVRAQQSCRRNDDDGLRDVRTIFCVAAEGQALRGMKGAASRASSVGRPRLGSMDAAATAAEGIIPFTRAAIGAAPTLLLSPQVPAGYGPKTACTAACGNS